MEHCPPHTCSAHWPAPHSPPQQQLESGRNTNSISSSNDTSNTNSNSNRSHSAVSRSSNQRARLPTLAPSSSGEREHEHEQFTMKYTSDTAAASGLGQPADAAFVTVGPSTAPPRRFTPGIGGGVGVGRVLEHRGSTIVKTLEIGEGQGSYGPSSSSVSHETSSHIQLAHSNSNNVVQHIAASLSSLAAPAIGRIQRSDESKKAAVPLTHLDRLGACGSLNSSDSFSQRGAFDADGSSSASSVVGETVLPKRRREREERAGRGGQSRMRSRIVDKEMDLHKFNELYSENNIELDSSSTSSTYHRLDGNKHHKRGKTNAADSSSQTVGSTQLRNIHSIEAAMNNDEENPLMRILFKSRNRRGAQHAIGGSCGMCVFIFVFALIVAIVGAMISGLSGYRFSSLSRMAAGLEQNKIVMNSSVQILDTSRAVFIKNSLAFTYGAMTILKDRVQNTSKEATESIEDEFLKSVLPQMTPQVVADSFNLYVSFCSEDDTVTGACMDWLYLRAACDGEEEECTFVKNNADSHHADVFKVKLVNGSISKRYVEELPIVRIKGNRNYLGGEGNSSIGRLLTPAPKINVKKGWPWVIDTTATYRREFKFQGRYVICDVESSMDRWFDEFDATLQRGLKSYSMLATGDGEIITYSYEGDRKARDVPCHYFTMAKYECGGTRANVVDAMSVQLKWLWDSRWSSAVDTTSNFATALSFPTVVVTFQEFLRVESPSGEPTVYFAAFSSSTESGFDEYSFIQMLLCILLIIACVVLLGGTSLFSIYQLRKSVELVSTLASHIIRYDLESMEHALNSKLYRPVCGDSLGYEALRLEFCKILENLHAYRPFLPQALQHARDTGAFSDVDDSGSETGDTTYTSCELPTDLDEEYDYDVGTANRSMSKEPWSWEQKATGQGCVSKTFAEEDSGAEQDRKRRSGVGAADEATIPLIGTSYVESKLQRQVLRRANGTVMTVCVPCVTGGRGGMVAASMNSYIGVVLQHVKAHGGIIEGIHISIITATFNFHTPSTRHQDRACRCAIAVRNSLNESGIKCIIALTSGRGFVGTCGTKDLKVRMVTGEAMELSVRLLSLHRYLGTSILATSSVVHKACASHVLVDVVRMDWSQPDRQKQYFVYEIVSARRDDYNPDHAFIKELFDTIRAKKLVPALELIGTYRKEHPDRNSWHVQRLEALCVSSPSLVLRGYRRREVGWDRPEGDDFMRQFVREMRLQQTPSISRPYLSELPYPSNRTDAWSMEHDVNTVRQRLKEEQHVPQFTSITNGLFNVFVQSDNLFPNRPPNSALFSYNQNVESLAASPTTLFPPSSDDKGTTTPAYSVVDEVTGQIGAPAPLNGSNNTVLVKSAWSSANSNEINSSVPDRSSSDKADVNNSALQPAPRVFAGFPESRTAVTQEFQLPQRIVDVRRDIFYLTTEMLGEGQFGKVYLAISESGVFLATKVFKLDCKEEDLMAELETLMKLQHENIVAYDSCAIQDGHFFIFMDYAAAGSMRHLMSTLTRIPERAARRYARDILGGLEYLHRMKCIHCDIKPDNVLLSSEGTCKLGDFGTATLGASRTICMRGTPRYMAPEAVRGSMTTQSDVYSFGITVAHMVLGHNPWHRYKENDDLFLLRLLNDPTMEPELPTGMEDEELETVIRRCCQRDPQERPQVEEMLSILT